jgi:hypothetical protein
MYFNCIRALLKLRRKIGRIFVIELLHEVHIISARPELAMLCPATITAIPSLPDGRCGLNLSVEITKSTIISMFNANKISYGHDHNNFCFGVFGSVNI